MIKSPNVAGAFYPADKDQLMELMDTFFANIKNNRLTPSSNLLKSGDLRAIVCPHAGYIYSGQVATYSYIALQEYLRSNFSNLNTMTIVILAPSHYEYFKGVSVGLFDKLETPLGTIDTDIQLGENLINKYPDYFSFVPTAFDQEHSYEVQLPFLQYIASKIHKQRIMKKGIGKVSALSHSPCPFKILTLVFGNVNPIEIGNILYELSKKEKIFFIVSSDLSHFMEYSNATKTDEETLQDFVDKNIEKIVNEADACGIYPRLALTQIAIKAKWTPKLLKYQNSGDTAGDRSRVVGYGSMIYLLN